MSFTKAEYQQIFEQSASTPFDNAHEAHWIWLTKEVLGLDLVRYMEAVCEAIKQGRWRNADDPRSYVKKVAKAEARRMEIANYPDEHLHLCVPTLLNEDGSSPMTHDDYIDYLSYDGPVREGGTWRARNPDFYEEEDYGEEGEYLTQRERLLNKVPDEFKVEVELSEDAKQWVEAFNARHRGWHISASPRIMPLWEAIVSKAGLDEGESLALHYRLIGLSRERAIAMQDSDEERRKLQAAWKRVDRTGLAKVRQVLAEKKNSG